MVLNRVGSKSKMVSLLLEYFPPHNTYVELFFGSGAVFFNKPRSQYNILNDINSEVINVFLMVKDRSDELIDAIEMTPYSVDVLDYFRKNQQQSDVWRAVSFLYRSNYTMYNKGETLKCAVNNYKELLLGRIKDTMKYISRNGIIWLNCNYNKVLENSSIQRADAVFVYADPPYLNTCNNYSEDMDTIVWTKDDLAALVEYLLKHKVDFAISEFQSPDLVDIAKTYKLDLVAIKDRKNIHSRAEEVLLLNYKYDSLF